MNAAEQAHMSRVIEKKQVSTPQRPMSAVRCSPMRRRVQMQDFLRMYSNLVERCFNSCCNDFTSKALSSKEVRSLPHSPLPPRNACIAQHGLTSSVGAMCDELHRQVPEAFGACWGSVCRTKRRYVVCAPCESDDLTDPRSQSPWVPPANECPDRRISSHARLPYYRTPLD